METTNQAAELETLELQLLLEGVYRRYGFDFRDYALASLGRRVQAMIEQEQLRSVAGLQEKLLHDPGCLERFLVLLSVNTTAMFRDPDFFLAFRTKVVPWLRTCPFLRLWHVGCSTGAEVYSLAILLQEEGLYARSRIYATDMNEAVLTRARAGIFPLAVMQEYTANYLQAGGATAFSDYYTAHSDHVVFHPALRARVVFAQHNLTTDWSFSEFQVILARNVLIYFNDALQDRVHRLLFESLALPGYLGLGAKESLKFTPQESCFEAVDDSYPLYRRIK